MNVICICLELTDLLVDTWLLGDFKLKFLVSGIIDWWSVTFHVCDLKSFCLNGKTHLVVLMKSVNEGRLCLAVYPFSETFLQKIFKILLFDSRSTYQYQCKCSDNKNTVYHYSTPDNNNITWSSHPVFALIFIKFLVIGRHAFVWAVNPVTEWLAVCRRLGTTRSLV